MSENHREPEDPEERVPVVERLDGHARITLDGLAITPSVKDGILQNVCFTRPRAVVGLGKSVCSCAHRQVDDSRRKRSQKNDDKIAVAMLKKHELYDRTMKSVVCRDTHHEHHGLVVCNSSRTCCVQLIKYTTIGLRFTGYGAAEVVINFTEELIQKPIQRLKFTKVVAHHEKIENQKPSLGYICPGEPRERSFNAPKFEDRSQEETEWQELGAREAAWKLAKNVFKLKEHERAAFFSSLENRCHFASTLKLEEREFVVDSGASMHVISKKDLSEAEMDTLTKSYSLTTVMTANGEV